MNLQFGDSVEATAHENRMMDRQELLSRLVFFLLVSVRLLRLLRALASAIRGSYIVGVFVVVLHSEIENKTTSTHTQEIFADFGHTKVILGLSRRDSQDDTSDQRVLNSALLPCFGCTLLLV